jgi:hypothetical protein
MFAHHNWDKFFQPQQTLNRMMYMYMYMYMYCAIQSIDFALRLLCSIEVFACENSQPTKKTPQAAKKTQCCGPTLRLLALKVCDGLTGNLAGRRGRSEFRAKTLGTGRFCRFAPPSG